jgi:hypothetical protein
MPARPLLQEQVFDVPYDLPSGRTVRLRGKWDAVLLRGSKSNPAIWLQENKTKGQIEEGKIRCQLTFDLQTMLYMIALTHDTGVDALERIKGWDGKGFRTPIIGVLYNVVRRPLSGGKGTIVRKKATKNHPEESMGEYYTRLAQYIRDEPESYFMRWDVYVSNTDIQRFRRECLDPILEQLCDWWEFVSQCVGQPWVDLAGEHPGIHWRHPFGVWNPLDEGGSSELDEYLSGGSTAGLARVDDLFPELKE